MRAVHCTMLTAVLAIGLTVPAALFTSVEVANAGAMFTPTIVGQDGDVLTCDAVNVSAKSQDVTVDILDGVGGVVATRSCASVDALHHCSAQTTGRLSAVCRIIGNTRALRGSIVVLSLSLGRVYLGFDAR